MYIFGAFKMTQKFESAVNISLCDFCVFLTVDFHDYDIINRHSVCADIQSKCLNEYWRFLLRTFW